MSDPLSTALGLRPLQDALNAQEYIDEDGVVHEITQVEEEPSDPYFDQAAEDAKRVRENILQLISDGSELFQDVKAVAMNLQDPDQYGAAARMFSELLKANRELMSVHKDIISLVPAPVETKQQANTINNIMITTSANEVMALLAKQGIEPKKISGSYEDDPDADA